MRRVPQSRSARTTPVHFDRRGVCCEEHDFFEETPPSRSSRCSSLPRCGNRCLSRCPDHHFWCDDEEYQQEDRRNEERLQQYPFWDPYYLHYYHQRMYSYPVYPNQGYCEDGRQKTREEIFRKQFYKEQSSSDEPDLSETKPEDLTENEEPISSSSSCFLQSIKSVPDINLYSVDDSNCSDEETNTFYDDEEEEKTSVKSEDASDNSEETSVRTEEIPHELSVILEESERSSATRLPGSNNSLNNSSETIGTLEEVIQEETKKEKDDDHDWWSEIKPSNEDDDPLYLRTKKQVAENKQEEIEFCTDRSHKNREVIVENHEESGKITEENEEEIFEDNFEEKSENVTVNSDDHKYYLNTSQSKESRSVKPKDLEEVEENYVRSAKERSENFEYQKEDFKCEFNSAKSSDNTEFKIKEGSSLYQGNLSVSSKKKVFKESRECEPQTLKKEGISVEKEDSSSEVVKRTTVCSVILDDEGDGEEIEEVKIPSIKERIAALKIASEKRKSFKDNLNVDRKDQVKAEKFKEETEEEAKKEHEEILIDRLEKNLLEDAKNEESSDSEEIDSGVTSDLSRHISDAEEYSELNKMSKYQRAATHSRLFKLLQEECEIEERNERDEEKLKKDKENMQRRRESLTLALKNEEGFSSSGVESLTSPVVSDKLVKELVQSLLKRKKCEAFRGMSIEKLHNAAYKILQEEMSEWKSDSTGSTAVQTPQDFYDNYEHWNSSEDYDILPSKTFKMIQEYSEQNRPGPTSGFLAKCPRVLSSKHLSSNPLKPDPEPVPVQSIHEPNAS